jgi:hypothetical protein
MRPLEYNKIITELAEWISGLKERRPSAGRRLLVESMTADTDEVADGLQRDVMERVSREIVLDADEGIDYKALADGVQPLLPVELKSPTDSETEACQQLNDALERLQELLLGIAGELVRHRKDEAYVKLYEREQRTFTRNHGVSRARLEYEEWKEKECLGSPSMEDLEAYRADMLLAMFDAGVFEEKVAGMSSNRRINGEVDFDGLIERHRIAPEDLYKYYRCLRSVCDFEKGMLVVNAKKVGTHFNAFRKEKGAKQRRTAFFKCMQKVEFAQQDMQALRERHGVRLAALPDSRRGILEALAELVGYGEWVAPASDERIMEMLQNALGVGIYELTGEDAEMSETLWSMLEATGKLRVAWQNLIGYFAEKRFFNPTLGSPALNEMFFGNKELYQNIDKGRPGYKHKSKKWAQVLPLLDRFVPKKDRQNDNARDR